MQLEKYELYLLMGRKVLKSENMNFYLLMGSGKYGPQIAENMNLPKAGLIKGPLNFNIIGHIITLP